MGQDRGVTIEIQRSDAHVRVEVDGVVLAESSHPTFLNETGLRPRTYLPKSDVRMDLLEATDRTTTCPHKGAARYWSVRAGGVVHENVAWCYEHPIPEAGPIAGLIAFYDERVDVFVEEKGRVAQ